MKTSKSSNIINLLEGLDRHSEFLSTAEIREELNASGIDTASALERTKGIIAAHLKKERSAWTEIADANKAAMQAISDMVESFRGKPHEEVFAAYAQFTSHLTPDQALAFRKRDNLSTDEMAQILDDFAKLKKSQDGESGESVSA